jgi:hypothetical protein
MTGFHARGVLASLEDAETVETEPEQTAYDAAVIAHWNGMTNAMAPGRGIEVDIPLKDLHWIGTGFRPRSS